MNKIEHLRICSDLHLEGFMSSQIGVVAECFVPHDERDNTSILVLAGDISSSIKQLGEFLSELSPRFAKIIYVPGNHEFYGHDIEEWCAKINTEVKGIGNLHMSGIGVGSVEIADTQFLFTTLWADGGHSLHEEAKVGRGLRDFYVIRTDDHRFTVQDMQALHRAQKSQLDSLLKIPYDGKTVVVTHHMPSYRLCHPRFGSEINGGFAANCEDILAYDHAPDLWIHGHTHDTIDTQLWKTRIICNPAGYSFETKRSKYNTFAPLFLNLPL